ncbi:TIGR03619 family F420-dependent LLM class oxidoreductase [Sphingobium tyrosinilyticum]|uniref:TIGR03619 family F420-dependent LLM class oxidoreductase n=1 Tax=Sphingobium tyrosinilyticum TaxID=2715436 RepID=A0ABV9F1N9_9SPHN
MKFSLHIPVGVITPGEFQTMDAIREMAETLECVAVDACYVTDHPAPDAAWLRQGLGHDTLDPFTALAVVAACSTTIRLHTNILVLPYRNPFITAKAAASLQVLSGGRLILGAAAGFQKAEFDALGVDFHKRGKLSDEALETIRLAWAGGPVIKQGMGFNAVGNEPRPAPDPQPLVWIGGGSNAAGERAARWGDGWSPVFVNPKMSKLNRDSGITSIDDLAQKVARVKVLREELGRTGPFDIIIGALVRPEALTRSEADRYIEELQRLAGAGVTWVMYDPGHASRAKWSDHVRWYGEEIIARSRDI